MLRKKKMREKHSDKGLQKTTQERSRNVWCLLLNTWNVEPSRILWMGKKYSGGSGSPEERSTAEEKNARTRAGGPGRDEIVRVSRQGRKEGAEKSCQQGRKRNRKQGCQGNQRKS